MGQHADEIPGFRIEMAEDLITTTRTDPSGTIFACHQSRPEQGVVCVGWLWRYGWDSIAIRLMLLRGDMHPDELEPDPSIELHETFQEVIEKLRADVSSSSGDRAQES